MARLKFLQANLRSPDTHDRIISALFNPFVLENDVTTNPWLEMRYQDIVTLSQFDQINDICDQLQQKYHEHRGQCLRMLLQGPDEGRGFCNFDLSQLKARDITCNYQDHEEEDVAPDEGTFACPCVLTDGTRCEKYMT
eukprot:10833789-Karenia_brevis.AAC.1